MTRGSGSKAIAILGMAAAIAGAMTGGRNDTGTVPNKERTRRYYDPSGSRGEVPNKTRRGVRRRQTRGRH